jgi:hypothetical protein
MTKLNYDELKSVLEKLDEGNLIKLHEWMEEDVSATDLDYREVFAIREETKHLYNQLGRFDFIVHFGGEGAGDSYWTVVHFKDHDIYIQFDGWYASHHGSEYSSMFQVWPIRVIQTKWTTKCPVDPNC